MTEKLRINVGCGPYKIRGFVNIDAMSYCDPDVIATAEHLPYESGTVDTLYAGHLIEHFYLADTAEVLHEWKRVLRVGGECIITFPDFEKTLELFDMKAIDWQEVNAIVYGKEKLEGAGEAGHHRQLATKWSIGPMMQAVFGNFDEMEECDYWPARVYWQTTLRSVKQ